MTTPTLRAVIFDLDGVLVRTDELHFQSWTLATDAHGIPFDRTTNERLRGVSRMDSLRLILRAASADRTPEQRQRIADEKNALYQSMLQELGPADVMPGGGELLHKLRHADLRTAVASSSRNGSLILQQLQLLDHFDVIVDGNDITRSKPDPEVFLLAAQRLNVPPPSCLVIEDAVAGIEAARRAGMRVIGIGEPQQMKHADLTVTSISSLSLPVLVGLATELSD